MGRSWQPGYARVAQDGHEAVEDFLGEARKSGIFVDWLEVCGARLCTLRRFARFPQAACRGVGKRVVAGRDGLKERTLRRN